jgi:CRISPR-associated protein Csm1
MDESKEIQIAAFLHDIGKFWQRAQGRITRDHEEYGKVACERLGLSANMCTLVWAHGKDHWKDIDPSMRIFALIIKEADQLSAAEREEIEGGFQSIYKRAVPIFNQVDIYKGKPSGNWIYDTYGPLSLEKQLIFPKQMPDVEVNRYKLYEELWEKLYDEYKSLNVSLEGYFDNLFYLWQKYTTFIPSAPGVAKPDVSLFDHSKTTAAIAVCLYKYLKNADKLKDETFIQNRTDERYLLIGGDISGVQRFIYSITSKGAAKGLRGRSLYLQLLSEAIAKYILRRLELPITNLLFCAGGHFNILAPSNSLENLEEIRRSIAEKLLKAHKGELYLTLEYIYLSGVDFEEKRYGERLKDLSNRLAERKKKKFAEILESYEGIFESIDSGGSRDTCEICGSEENVNKVEDIKICRFCKSFEELAEEIAKANYLVEIIGDAEKRVVDEGTWRDVISKFDIRYECYEKLDEDLIRGIEADKITIYKLNDTNFLKDAYLARGAKSPISFGFKFIGRATPYKQGTIKSFDELADDSEGVNQWAVLRMDVDDLGKIISQGLGGDQTISRISTLSSMLSLFFTGWIEKMCQKEEYKENIYTIYSGGDDLFIVGSWSVIPEIAREIYEDFRNFTCQNPNITLSGGIFIAPAKKFPLYQAAELAGDAEELAKLKGKDAITFFETPVKWERFNNGVIELKCQLKDIVSKTTSRAILQKLYAIYNEFDRQRKKHGDILAKYDDRYGRWRWLLAYSIARMKKGEKDLDEKLEKIHTLATENIEYLPISVRWVELLTREKRRSKYE